MSIAQTGGSICGSQLTTCLGTFFTRTVRAFSTSVLRPGSEVWESGAAMAATRASLNVFRTGLRRDFCRDLLTSPMVQIIEVRVVKISTALALVLTVNLSASQNILNNLIGNGLMP